MKPILAIVLDKRTTKKSGRIPVKLRITYHRKQMYYPVNIDLTPEEFKWVQNPESWPKSATPALKRQLKDWKLTCDASRVKAQEIIDTMGDFSFREFERILYKNFRPKEQDVYQWYAKIIEKQRQEGRVGTAASYNTSMVSLAAFSPKLHFRDITPDFLREYEKWMLSKGKAKTTVGIYLRPLRAIMNQAIDEGVISRETYYPFSKRKYQIPASRNVKKALSKEEIQKIFQYQGVPGTWYQKARDFFIFSYLASGMNMKDIALLKFKNIDGEFIRFTRAKTLHTNRSDLRPITVHMSDEINQIIIRWGNSNTDLDNFIFPIIESGATPEREAALIKQFTKNVNHYLKYIAAELGITRSLSTYYARHSFATILKRGGASVDLISESLGHSSTKTTASYLDSFDDETKKILQSKLLQF